MDASFSCPAGMEMSLRGTALQSLSLLQDFEALLYPAILRLHVDPVHHCAPSAIGQRCRALPEISACMAFLQAPRRNTESRIVNSALLKSVFA